MKRERWQESETSNQHDVEMVLSVIIGSSYFLREMQ